MPDDPTPLGDAMSHRFTDQKIPDPKPGSGASGGDEAAATDIKRRPGLPEHLVVDTGPGSSDGPDSLDKQKG